MFNDDFGVANSFSMFSAVFVIFFVGIFAIILFSIVSGLRRWRKNNNSPRLTVDASVVSKRLDVSHHHNRHTGSGAGSYRTSSTRYYVTFQVESGDRMELHVDDTEYGLLVEGDVGKLSFQGTRYLGFNRMY